MFELDHAVLDPKHFPIRKIRVSHTEMKNEGESWVEIGGADAMMAKRFASIKTSARALHNGYEQGRAFD